MRASARSTSSPARATPSSACTAAPPAAPRWLDEHRAVGAAAHCAPRQAPMRPPRIVRAASASGSICERGAAASAEVRAPARWSPPSSCPTRPRAPADRGQRHARVGRARRDAAQFCGRPIAMPEPAVTSGRPASAAPMCIRSSSETASTTAIADALARSASKRSTIAARAPRGDQPSCATRPDRASSHLRLQHAHEVGVGHRRQRVVAHAAVARAARRRRTGGP